MPVSRQPLAPKIEADLLAEYILAGPDRRRDILLNACAAAEGPSHFRAADETLCAYLLSIPKQEGPVRRKIEVLRTLEAFATDKQARIADNIAALEAFLDHPKREFLDALETFPGPRQGMLRLAGVNVAVRPEIIAVDTRTNSFGFVKLRFSRRPLEPEEVDHLSGMLYAFSQLCTARFQGTLNLDLTCVVDVFDGTIVRAGAVRIGRWGKVRSACAEFAANWAMCHTKSRGGRSTRRWSED
jgi:hypothetical protein